MSTILVVEDMPICREPLAALLRARGYDVVCAEDGLQALQYLCKQRPNLVLLDLGLPKMDGIELLKSMWAHAEMKKIPVIVLTGSSDRKHVLAARALGACEYLLKAAFSLEHLLERIERYAPMHLQPVQAAGRLVADPVRRPSPSAAALDPAPAPVRPRPAASAEDEPIPRLLTREETIQRVEAVTGSRTLAGVVSEVVRLANSPRGAISDLAGVLKKDPVLASQVLGVANSAKFATQKLRITSVEEAVRNLGAGRVATLAATAGIFGAFPVEAKDGFDLLRCWLHSFATAAVLERILPATDECSAGTIHLIGLCHDLGEIVLRQHLAAEYQQILKLAERLGKLPSQVESVALGVRHDELIGLILDKMALPTTLSLPIRDFHAREGAARPPSKMTTALRIADYCANAMMLAANPGARIAPLTRGECRMVLGSEEFPVLDDTMLRCDCLMTTQSLARLTSRESEILFQPLIPKSELKVAYFRHPTLAPLDPLLLALTQLCNVELLADVPTEPGQLAQYQAIVIAAPALRVEPFIIDKLQALHAENPVGRMPVVYLSPASDACTKPGEVLALNYPLSLACLAEAVCGVCGLEEAGKENGAAAEASAEAA
jgi:CheY-like chemotaxis protein/HD-like signal output (HDOD) protein